VSRVLSFLLGLGLLGICTSSLALDPTAPPARLSTPASAPLALAELRLQAVLRDRQGARAIINGQSLRVGERLADARIVEIRAQSVLIERQGSREWLRLAAPLVQPSR
jgi:MSHA biogenesis protein MshK